MAKLIGVHEITGEQRDRILAMREGHFADVKSCRVKPAKLSETVSALANATGGELFIGVEETKKGRTKQREWQGFEDVEEANGLIQLFHELFPLGQFFSYDFLECHGEPGLILHVQVRKSRDVVEASNGHPYVRRGAQNIPIKSADALQRLRLDKGVDSFEATTIDAPIEVVSDSMAVTKFIIEVVPSSEPDPWLRKQLLIVDEKPTVAGALLFADEPQALLPKRSAIKIFRYETRDEVGTRDSLSFDPITIEGCAYDLIHAAVEKTVELIEGISVLGAKGLEPIEYPEEALHEIITNAVLHRDYSVATDVQVRIFDNRIEVESPGRLPGHITEANILSEQFARNPSVVRLINKFPNPPNKDVGEGLNTAFEAMRKLRLKDPVISEGESSVLVSIRHESLASPEEAILGWLKNHDEIGNRTVRELTGITSENAVKEVFYRLRDKGLLERTPGKRGSASTWRIPKKEG